MKELFSAVCKNRRLSLSLMALAVLSLSVGLTGAIVAQDDPAFIAMREVEYALTDKITKEQSGGNVYYPDTPEIYQASNAATGVRGNGLWSRRGNQDPRKFSFDGLYNIRSGRVTNLRYNWIDDDDSGSSAQDPGDVAIRNVQDALRDKVRREMRGGYLTFETADVYRASNAETGVRGAATYSRGRNDSGTRLTYDGIYNVRNGRVTNVNYRLDRPDNGGGDRGVPNWAVGTFRGEDGEADLTINSDGSATIRSLRNSESFSGSFSNGVLRFTWGEFNLYRDGDGIRTEKIGDRRQRTTYRRLGGSDNGGGDRVVPRWAIGTFRGDDGEADLTINSDGSATIRRLRTDEVFSGNFSNGVLRFDWGEFNLYRDGNGIRTEKSDDRGQRTTYRRLR